jgi:hypothetical protein
MLERWIVCTPLSVNVFVTLATQKHLEYYYNIASQAYSIYECSCKHLKMVLGPKHVVQ